MLVYAGIDEAGYGPLMGPLCVACSEWTVNDASDPADPPNLWRSLSQAVCTTGRDRRGRVAMADSKKLKGASGGHHHPLCALERGVLVALGIATRAGADPTLDSELFETLGALGLDEHAPWYSGELALPVGNTPARIALGRAMLETACARRGVRATSLRCAAVDAREINAAASTGEAKSSVSWSLVMDHARRVKRAHWDTPLRLAIDRQGGRIRYREDLMREFDGARLTVLDESEQASLYRIEGLGADTVVSFSVEAEASHLPVALASMTAKYTRELWMRRLNRWFAGRVAGLAPTAGYVQDGRRFVASVRDTLASSDLPEALLVRAI